MDGQAQSCPCSTRSGLAQVSLAALFLSDQEGGLMTLESSHSGLWGVSRPANGLHLSGLTYLSSGCRFSRCITLRPSLLWEQGTVLRECPALGQCPAWAC